MDRKLKYGAGFGNHFETEALPGAIPKDQNSPQKCPYGLYAEQLSGTAFTVARQEALKTWFYRIRPSVRHSAFTKVASHLLRSAPCDEAPATPNQLRWGAMAAPGAATDFVKGLVTIATNGDVSARAGCAVHLYVANAPMKDFFYNADGDFLILPYKGTLHIRTECGDLEVSPREVCLLPRGIKFQVLTDPKAAGSFGYVCENYGAPFRLPNLGPIGANGLANPRHFLAPVAAYEDQKGPFKMVTKFQGDLWECSVEYSPLDVVGWQGNYTPYKYNLDLFQTINTVSFDHPDPSIFTVLTSPSDSPGTANIDFVIFPPRWMVAEHTFRPPYYHRNVMSEYMGLIAGQYDAKGEGFVPGGGSLHNCMIPHGPDAESFEKGTAGELKPERYKDTLAFMFESNKVFRPTKFALETPLLQKDYLNCWSGLKSHFDTKRVDA